MARMIVFWSPYIMILTSVAVCDLRLWTFLVNKLNQSSTNQVLVTFLRHLILCFLLAVIYISHKDAILAHLEELREFWDPDTVDLMEWIQQKVPLTAAFTGKLKLVKSNPKNLYSPVCPTFIVHYELHSWKKL